MIYKKIAWLTDPHLNFLEKSEREVFYNQINQSEVSGVLITGDIAESEDICSLLNELSEDLNKPILVLPHNAPL